MAYAEEIAAQLCLGCAATQYQTFADAPVRPIRYSANVRDVPQWTRLKKK